MWPASSSDAGHIAFLSARVARLADVSWQTVTYRELNSRVVNLVGGKTGAELDKLGIATVGDLLRHRPRRYISGTDMSDFRTLMVDDEVAVVARVHSAEHVHGRAKQRVAVSLTDGRGNYLSAAFFAEKKYLIEYWLRVLQPGARGIFIGKVGEFKGKLQLSHPDFVVLDAHNQVIAGKAGERDAIGRQARRDTLVGIYPATRGAATWVIADSIALALEAVGVLADPFPDWVLGRAEVLGFTEALTQLHAPHDLAAAEAGLRRLRFDEALTAQLALSYRRAERRQQWTIPIAAADDGVLAAFDAQLPFTLTDAQTQVSAEIFADLAATHPMSRLLQGEVGSGKTVVALRAMLAAVDAGAQAALLAPTEVLAKQHFKSISTLMGDLALGVVGQGAEIALLTGSRTTAVKRDIQAGLASGQINIVVGTHALLSQGVDFANLGLVVVDEQHRFGVEQRAALAAKVDPEPHTLVMTATPIPRSVAMTVFGDLDVSSLRELPAGRAEVKTVFVNTMQHPHWVDRAWERVKEEVSRGRQVFVVCPRIDPSDADDSADDGLEEAARGRQMSAVTVLAEHLARGPLAGIRLGTLHGRQPVAERDETMAAFAAGDLDVLVATTVIEVGVDVPNASMMVVMDADRFGLSQLHQLRGRIGRGEHEGLCLLLAPVAGPGSPADERLQALVATRDGFELAEVDVRLRREGNVLGAEQSGGVSSLRALRVLEDQEMILMAKDIAEQVVSDDPGAAAPWVRDALRQADSAGEWAART